MRRRSNSHSPISLFTFLDTLVCTMGSLILMLLAMTPKIRERAEAREQARLAAQIQAAPEEVLTDPVPQAIAAPAEDQEQLAALRQQRREAWLKSVADARQALAARQGELRRQRQLLKDALAQFKEVHDQLLKARLKEESLGDATQTLSDRETKLAEQEASITQKIALTRKNIELLDRRQTAAANEYALVPYDGTSGTVRRPIYIECSRRGFRFLPEDETLSPVDLKEFHDNDNPLLNGTKTLLRFWKLKRRESGGSEPEPYVLLLVRPSGCLNYYVARGLLSSLGANFGYELIEENWKLSIPPPDPVAKTVLKETLDMAVQNHGQVKDSLADAAVRGRFGSRGRNSSRGGWFDGDLPDDGDDLDPIPFGTDPNAIRKPGTGTSRGTGAGPKAGSGRAAGIGGGTKSGAGGRGGSAGEFGGDGRNASRNGATGLGTPGGDSENGGDTFASRRLARGGSGALGGGAGSNSDGAPGSESTDGLSNGEPGSGNGSRRGAGRGGPSRAASRPAAIGGGDASGGDGSGDGDLPLEIPPDYTPRKLPAADGSGGIGEIPMRSIPDGSESAPGRGAAGSGGKSSSAGGASSGNSKSGSQAAGSPSPDASSADSDDSAGSSSGMTDSASPDSSGGSPLGKVQMGGPGASIRLGRKTKRKTSDKDDDPDSGPRIAEEEGKSGGERVRSRGPRLWGRARPKASIGLERKLEIRVLADRILVGSKDIVIPVGNGETTDEMVNQVVVGIDHVAEKWGEPPASFYWVPTVKFVVYPGGNIYYERLRGTLDTNWGVTSVVEYAPDKKPAKAKGVQP